MMNITLQKTTCASIKLIYFGIQLPCFVHFRYEWEEVPKNLHEKNYKKGFKIV